MISINYLIVITVKLLFILSNGQTIKLLISAWSLFSVDMSRIQQTRFHLFFDNTFLSWRDFNAIILWVPYPSDNYKAILSVVSTVN